MKQNKFTVNKATIDFVRNKLYRIIIRGDLKS